MDGYNLSPSCLRVHCINDASGPIAVKIKWVSKLHTHMHTELQIHWSASNLVRVCLKSGSQMFIKHAVLDAMKYCLLACRHSPSTFILPTFRPVVIVRVKQKSKTE